MMPSMMIIRIAGGEIAQLIHSSPFFICLSSLLNPPILNPYLPSSLSLLSLTIAVLKCALRRLLPSSYRFHPNVDMAQIAAFGRSQDTDSDGGLERQIGHLRDLYENALLLDGSGDLAAAETGYEQVLQHPILSNALDGNDIPKMAILLRSLTLKNLAALHIRQSRFAPGLSCYILSAQQTHDGWKDTSLLLQIGSCARNLDLLALARQCFERCLHHEPDQGKALQNLLEIVTACGDREHYSRLTTFARYTLRARWSQHGLERLPDREKDDGDGIPFEQFCKRRRVVSEIIPVAQIDLVWRCDSQDQVTFNNLFDFLLPNIDRLYSQHQPFEALSAPVSLQVEISDAQPPGSVSPEPSPKPSTEDDDSQTGASSSNGGGDHDNDHLASLLEFLHSALPQQDIRLISNRLIFFNQSSPGTPIIEPSRSYDEPVAVRAVLAAIPPANSGLMVLAQHIWDAVVSAPPPSMPADRLLSVRQALNDRMSLNKSPHDLLLAAELTFDRDPDAAAVLILGLPRHPTDIFVRVCWLLGLWHTHYRRHLTAYLYLAQCAERIGDQVVVRDKCISNRVISAATISSQMSSLSMWELCEGAIASDDDCIQNLHRICISDESDFTGVPNPVQVAALETIRRRFASNLVLLRLIAAAVPPTSFDEAGLARFCRCVEDLMGSEPLGYLPGRFVDEVSQALSQALYFALRDDLAVDVVNVVVLAIVQFACRYGALVSGDVSAKVALYNAGHAFLAQFEGGCNERYLQFGLDFIDDVRDRDKFDAISAIYCCLYGPLDPRFECHQRFETIRLSGQILPIAQCRNLLDYCVAAEQFLNDEERDEFTPRCVSLLKQLRTSIPFPTDLQPSDDFVSSAIYDSRYQLPFVTCYTDDHDIYSRYYDYFAHHLVNTHSVCSYATRICASTTSDMNILNDLLRYDLRLYPRRSRSWYALAWCYLHQRMGFIQGIQSTIDSLQGAELDPFLEPLLCARRCLQRTDILLQAETDSIQELRISPAPSLTCDRVVQDQLVLEFRLFELFARDPRGNFSKAPQLERVQRLLRRLPTSPRVSYIQALLFECLQASPVDILHQYALAAQSIPDALYAVHALRLDLARSPEPDWNLISSYSYGEKTGPSLISVIDDVAAVFSSLCEQDPEFFRPALRLAQVALLTGSADYADRAVSELSLFINDKTRLRRVRPRKGSLGPQANDTEFIRALLFDPNLDHAEEDCYVASLVLCRNRGNWEELESIYYNAVRPRRDKQITLMYASILIATLNERAASLRDNVDIALRDSLFKRAFECCLDLIKGHRDVQVFMPALLVLPYRIVKEGTPFDGDVLPSDVVDHEEIRLARDWCAELQCARSVRNALKRLSFPSGTYNLQHHIVSIQAEFKSFQLRR